MKKTRLIALGLMITTLCAGCGAKAGDKESGSDDVARNIQSILSENQGSDGVIFEAADESSQADSQEKSNVETAQELTSDELSELQDLFNSETYNYFVRDAFDCPEKIDWKVVMLIGAGISEECDYDSEEWNIVNDACGGFPDYGMTIKITKDNAKEFVKAHSGLEFNDSMLTDYWYYSDTYDAYYYQLGDLWPEELECVSGTKNDNEYTVRIIYTNPMRNDPARECVFVKDGDNIVFKKNALLWDEIVDAKSYDFVTSQYGETKVYTVTADASDVIFTKDGTRRVSFQPCLFVENDSRIYFSSITDIAVGDYNCDGYTDSMVIGETSRGTAIYYSQGRKGDQYISSVGTTVTNALASDVTMEKALDYMQIYVKDGKCDDYNHAFAQCVYIDSLSRVSHLYGLKDLTGGGIPELIIAATSDWGDNFIAYSYENGTLKLIAEGCVQNNITGPVYGYEQFNYEDFSWPYDYEQVIAQLNV